MINCLSAPLDRLRIRRRPGNSSRNRLSWKWRQGDTFDQFDLGNPTSNTAYAFCIYDSSAQTYQLALEATIPPGPDWYDRFPLGYFLKDRSGLADGIQRLQLRPGLPGAGRVRLRAAGVRLTLPAAATASAMFNQETDVVSQLVNDLGVCWNSSFDLESTRRNSTDRFKAKTN